MSVDLNDDTDNTNNKNEPRRTCTHVGVSRARRFREIFRCEIISLFSADSLHAVRVTGARHETVLQMLLNFLVRPSRESAARVRPDKSRYPPLTSSEIIARANARRKRRAVLVWSMIECPTRHAVPHGARGPARFSRRWAN